MTAGFFTRLFKSFCLWIKISAQKVARIIILSNHDKLRFISISQVQKKKNMHFNFKDIIQTVIRKNKFSQFFSSN